MEPESPPEKSAEDVANLTEPEEPSELLPETNLSDPPLPLPREAPPSISTEPACASNAELPATMRTALLSPVDASPAATKISPLLDPLPLRRERTPEAPEDAEPVASITSPDAPLATDADEIETTPLGPLLLSPDANDSDPPGAILSESTEPA